MSASEKILPKVCKKHGKLKLIDIQIIKRGDATYRACGHCRREQSRRALKKFRTVNKGYSNKYAALQVKTARKLVFYIAFASYMLDMCFSTEMPTE